MNIGDYVRTKYNGIQKLELELEKYKKENIK